MKSLKNGTSTLQVEVSNISPFGFWLLMDDTEYFLPFKSFPWFKQARISDIVAVERLSETHLYWSKLDIDLTLDMIQSPEKYPLVSA
ncbi:MAG: DUF2442 domain-containing protein [Prolixibacteraceae bacterium]|nr:DUF2442 domain-containing protein [Prolixibacteraceae bacterium]